MDIMKLHVIIVAVIFYLNICSAIKITDERNIGKREYLDPRQQLPNTLDYSYEAPGYLPLTYHASNGFNSEATLPYTVSHLDTLTNVLQPNYNFKQFTVSSSLPLTLPSLPLQNYDYINNRFIPPPRLATPIVKPYRVNQSPLPPQNYNGVQVLQQQPSSATVFQQPAQVTRPVFVRNFGAPIALGSGSLGFTTLPNGVITLGSGSLGYTALAGSGFALRGSIPGVIPNGPISAPTRPIQHFGFSLENNL